LVFNSGWQKNLLSVFWTFQELRDSKKGKVGEHGSKNLRRVQRAEVGQQEKKEVDLGAHHAFGIPCHMVQAKNSL
jgi:hypothetical protein